MTLTENLRRSEDAEGARGDAGAHALLASNRRRLLVRRGIAWASLPLILVALLFVGKLVSLYAFAYQSITAYVAGDYTGSVSAAENLNPANWFEPYKAPFDQGVGLGLTAGLGQGFGEIGEQHGEPQPERHDGGEPVGVADRQHRGEHAADLDHEHHRVAGHLPGVELAQGTGQRLAELGAEGAPNGRGVVDVHDRDSAIGPRTSTGT